MASACLAFCSTISTAVPARFTSAIVAKTIPTTYLAKLRVKWAEDRARGAQTKQALSSSRRATAARSAKTKQPSLKKSVTALS